MAIDSVERRGQAKWLADLMLLGVAVVWGTSYGVTKGAVAIYPVLGFLAIRFCLTFLVLLPVWKNIGRAEIKETIKVGVPLGAILLAIFICETSGVALTLASNAAFLISMCVVFTPFVEWVVLRSYPGGAAFVAAGVSVVGAFLITSGVQLKFTIGDGLIIMAAILRACMVTFTKKHVAGRNISSLALTAVQTGVVGLGCVLLGVALLPGGLPALPHETAFWNATLYLVAFCTVFAFFAQNYAVRRTSPTQVHLLMGTEPVFGALFAWLWLGEQLSVQVWLGGFLIVCASGWAALRHR